LRHRWRNPGDTITKAVFVLAGFEQGERPSEFHLSSGMKGESTVDVDLEGDEEGLDEGPAGSAGAAGAKGAKVEV
jgi:hypothetical protein